MIPHSVCIFWNKCEKIKRGGRQSSITHRRDNALEWKCKCPLISRLFPLSAAFCTWQNGSNSLFSALISWWSIRVSANQDLTSSRHLFCMLSIYNMSQLSWHCYSVLRQFPHWVLLTPHWYCLVLHQVWKNRAWSGLEHARKWKFELEHAWALENSKWSSFCPSIWLKKSYFCKNLPIFKGSFASSIKISSIEHAPTSKIDFGRAFFGLEHARVQH